MINHFKGLIPAVFTPMKDDGSINLDHIPKIVDHLFNDRVAALYVCGSTGEGPSLTSDERKAVAESYTESAKGRLPIIVNVGHNSLKDAQNLAKHAQKIGADAISAVPPSYFKINSLQNLIDCIIEITFAAPELPFYYYHLPAITGVDFDMIDFIRFGCKCIPSLTGIKYSNFKVFELQACLEFENGKYDILFGSDEMLIAALAAGAQGAVGATYNFAAPLYNNILQSFKNGDIEKARRLQSLSIKMIRLQFRYRGFPAFKSTMKLLGLDCGPSRLPQVSLTGDELKHLKKDLAEIEFFDWGRNCD